MEMHNIMFYSMWVFVFVVMVWLVFAVAKHQNYHKGYRHGWNEHRAELMRRILTNDKQQQTTE